MLKKSKAITLICGGLSVAATVILYLLTFDNIFTIPMRWVSLMFLLISELIGTVKALTIKKSIFGVANITTSLLHLGIVLVLSIIYINVFPLLIKAYILLNILALCALLVFDIIIIYFGEHLSSKNSELASNQAVVNSLYTKAASLAIEYKQSDYSNDLEEIGEMLKYSDNSVLSNDEIVILNKLEELQKLLPAEDEGISQKISDIKDAIKLRSLKVQGAKRGSY